MDGVNLILDKCDFTAKVKLSLVFWFVHGGIGAIQCMVLVTQYLLWVCDPQDFSAKTTNKCYGFIYRCEFWYRNVSRLVYTLPVLNLKNKFDSNLQCSHCTFLIFFRNSPFV